MSTRSRECDRVRISTSLAMYFSHSYATTISKLAAQMFQMRLLYYQQRHNDTGFRRLAGLTDPVERVALALGMISQARCPSPLD